MGSVSVRFFFPKIVRMFKQKLSGFGLMRVIGSCFISVVIVCSCLYCLAGALIVLM